MSADASTAVEKISGSPLTALSFTAIAAGATELLANGHVTALGLAIPLLPVLAGIPAFERQRKRNEGHLADVNQRLESLGDKLNAINDAQHKLINETVLAMLHTTCDDKIKYLKSAIENSVDLIELKSHESVQLSRVLRDISANEVVFLVENFRSKNLKFLTGDKTIPEGFKGVGITDVKWLDSDNQEGRIAMGLISLGVVGKAGFDDVFGSNWKFMPISAKLIALLKTES